MRWYRSISSFGRPGAAITVVALAAVALLPGCISFFSHPTGTYYVSPSGHDSADGLTPQTAWRTLHRASEANLRPGNRLLFQGGHRFTGHLRLGTRDGGSPRNPIRIGSYGKGRAVIAGTGGSAIVVVDTSGVVIANLILTGGRPARRGSAGVQLFSDRPAGHQERHIVIEGLDVSGFDNGISIGAVHPSAGFGDVSISNCVLHANIRSGISSYGPRFDATAPSYAHSRLRIADVEVFGNRGDPADHHSNTGNGIVLGSVSNALVTRSTAHDNGGANGAPHEGPIGIWAYDSTGVVIEHSLSYHNQTATQRDGGGFGFDQNTSDSILQYNLSYGNAGAGYQVYAPGTTSNTRNVVRFNISSGDAGRTIDAAGIIVAGRVSATAVYQNTVVVGRAPGHPALWIGRVRYVAVRNNIFLTTDPGPIVVATHPLGTSDALLQGNDYFTTGSGWLVRWGGGTEYGSLRAWRAATGQELAHAAAAGIAADPRLTGPVLGLTNPTATAPGNGVGFVPRPGSPVLGAGIDLSKFGVDPGSTDYSGRSLSKTAPNIGAG